ncbi:cytochrome P450 [Thelonectria olida]|uniref:Cytochrome P450 n=1 Tax=Thelonectria olida TaxID=1576542 RepID=A0A9P8VWU0_9HYPO|nr:cytochrome P450 [Thelonectria olida]
MLASGLDNLIHVFILGSLLLLLFVKLSYYRNTLANANCKTPVTVHSLVPFIGPVLSMMARPELFLRQLLLILHDTPIQILLPGSRLYLASPGDQIAWMLKGSRHLVPTPSLLYAFQTFFGLHKVDSKVFEHANISAFEADLPFSTNHPDPSRRIMEHQRRDFMKYLQGQGLKVMLIRFIKNLTNETLQQTAISNDWIQIPDLYTFMVTKVFRSEVEALYGRHIFTTCPRLHEDFWSFYDAFPRISLGLPRWLSRSSYQTQDRILKSLRQWRISCQETRSLNDHALQSTEYDPVWGSQYIRKMLGRYFDLGFTEDGVDTAMLGFLFVTFANTIPATAWMMLYVLLDKRITERVKEELSTIDLMGSGFTNTGDLASRPLLNSIYCETLRLRVASAVGRKSTIKIRTPGGWEFEANNPIMFPSWLSGLDDSFWNTGRTLSEGGPQHPVDTFWAERFLQYPDDPLSGPARTESLGHQPSVEKEVPKSANDDRRAKLVTKGVQGHWFPFGGGVSKCPGEALARQTILISVAFMFHNFEIRLSSPDEARKAGSKHRALPFGSHAFDRPVPITIRRRRFLP